MKPGSWLGVLTLLFITLKLTGYIDWHWVWVLSPAWGGCLMGLILVVYAYIMMAITLRRLQKLGYTLPGRMRRYAERLDRMRR